MSNSELASSYAALILADDGIEITADKLQTLIKAAGIEDVEPIWTQLFAKVHAHRLPPSSLASTSVCHLRSCGQGRQDLLTNVSAGGAAAPAAGGAAAAAGGAAEEAKEEAEEEKEESDEDMGFGLFD
ncbi:unnamed protein product [Parascedosporium putredinis]|uniref:Large ribosomal subunit protein P1 n=1 Tax=Parascedosporium putredinis TaxID=1442378 RepID=A0A9P1H4W3_9PEZI|nr:unnamed protein product [Parascedosporium putredinis]CAI7995869.1 unnamed protein product [Parascedosporium putredinis]